MNFYGLTFILFLLTSGCCKDEIVETHNLNEFEKTLIPYTSNQELSYIDEEGNTVIANSQPKESVLDTNIVGPSKCSLAEYEKETGFLNFQSLNVSIELRLTAQGNGPSLFYLSTSSADANNNGEFVLACESNNKISVQEKLSDLSIEQFDFQNILVFQNCLESTTEIERILYSSSKGVEFIEFGNGKWLKLNE